jgi:glycerol-3-phosphate acyltransferase PlsX
MSKPVIKAHGSSNARAVKSAIRQAMDYAGSGFIDYITQNVGYMKPTKEETQE